MAKIKSQTKKVSKVIRKISRFTGLVAAVMIMGSIGVSFWVPRSQFQLLKEKLVKNPTDTQAHLQLAEVFLLNHQYSEAENELLQIKVLGASNSKFGQLLQQKLLQNPNDIQKLITAWEKIMVEKPGYRDGWMQLAYLNYKIYQDEKAKQYLSKALEIDPNYSPARELEQIIYR